MSVRRRPAVLTRITLAPSSALQQVPAAALLVVVVVAAVVALSGRAGGRAAAVPPTPPSPAPTTSAPVAGVTPAVTAPASPTPVRCRVGAPQGTGTRPYRICIPSLGVDAAVLSLGLNSDHTVQVPPLSRVGDAGWYRYSAPPGSVGPTVILGHIDSATYGDGVFYRLGTLHAGDDVFVFRDDGMVATFEVTRVQEVSKRRFPSQDVYGPTSGPALRLVTCGGAFDATSGSYEDNIVVFGTLRSLRPR